MSPFVPLFQVLSMIGVVLKYTWWIIFPFGLYSIFKPVWKSYVIGKFIGAEMKMTLLRIRIPKDMIANPKAMENALAGLLASYYTITFTKQLLNGNILDYFSLEIVGNEGDLGFYILTPERSIRLVEKLFYANFPDIEIDVGVEDYFNKLPKTIPDDNWSMWGAKLILDKPDAVPINTYPNFEDKFSGELADPLATIFEAMGTLGPGENLIFQIQVGQPDFEWRKKGNKEIDKVLTEYNMVPGADVADGAVMKILPFAQQELIKSMYYKMEKPAFSTQVLYAYIARKEVFNGIMSSNISGTIQQFASGNKNSLNTDKYYTTSAYFLFSAERGRLRRRRLYRMMQDRDMQGILNVLNIEELATLFHFPTPMTKVPSIPRLDSKRAPAPPNLPVSG